MHDKKCSGCFTIKKCTLSNVQKQDCPCRECLLKVICDKSCEAYIHNRYLFG